MSKVKLISILSIMIMFTAFQAQAMESHKRSAENELVENQSKYSKKETITIRTKDDQPLEVEESVARISQTLNDLIDGLPVHSREVQVTEIDYDTLKSIMNVLKVFYKHHGTQVQKFIEEFTQADIFKYLKMFKLNEFKPLFQNNISISNAINFLDLPLLEKIREAYNYECETGLPYIFYSFQHGQAFDKLEEVTSFLRSQNQETNYRDQVLESLQKEILDSCKRPINQNHPIYQQYEIASDLENNYSVYIKNNLFEIEGERERKTVAKVPANNNYNIDSMTTAKVDYDMEKIAFCKNNKLVIISVATGEILSEINLSDLDQRIVNGFFLEAEKPWSHDGEWLTVHCSNSFDLMICLINLKTKRHFIFNTYHIKWTNKNLLLIEADEDLNYSFFDTANLNLIDLAIPDDGTLLIKSLSNGEYIGLLDRCTYECRYIFNSDIYNLVNNYLMNKINFEELLLLKNIAHAISKGIFYRLTLSELNTFNNFGQGNNKIGDAIRTVLNKYIECQI